MLEITGFDEVNMMGGYQTLLPNGLVPIIHNMQDDEEIGRFFTEALLQSNSEELTSEAEALLVSVFKPEYNKIKYDVYPNIANGTRSAGYTLASLNVTGMPLLLKTDYRPSTEMGSVKF
ncbi:hypothetical protein [Agrobacterium tumefaciens]|uniref:hypothetical protein n=1 Tax=Agrobacterium tumefaciens TaxID=358 RepID=UPI0015743704|nr:hypothetical protein [Agrobacterium tumefaciens]WCJ63719.1 hypothetical protein G6M15_05860 [Agrobacterium tumefaciens]